jgi:undecaprenyl-diphosphatase
LILDIIKAVILGIIEGITEWLPISSTGHLILADEFIKLNVSHDFIEMFNVVIQLGAILAVILLFFHKLNPFSPKKTSLEKKETWEIWLKVILACVPAIAFGLPFDDFLDAHFHKFLPVAIMLIIYGIAFIVVENMHDGLEPKIKVLRKLSYKTAFFIGLFQVLSLIPGTSRSGATILGAIILGCSRYVATEFSFFLGIPVMFGASGLKLAKYVAGGNSFGGAEVAILLTGFIVSFIVSIFAIKFLLGYIRNHDFKVFGWYRIVLGAILIIYFIIKLLI